MAIQVNKDGSGIIVVDDFSGGLNTYIHQSQIQDTETPNTLNCWNYNNTLSKIPGHTIEYINVRSSSILSTAYISSFYYSQAGLADTYNYRLYHFGRTINHNAPGETISTSITTNSEIVPLFSDTSSSGQKIGPICIEVTAIFTSGSDKVVLSAPASATLKYIKGTGDCIVRLITGDSFLSFITATGSISGSSLTCTTLRNSESNLTATAGIMPGLGYSLGDNTSDDILYIQPSIISMNNQTFFLLNKNSIAPASGGFAYGTSATGSSSSDNNLKCINITAWPPSLTCENHKNYIFLGNIGSASGGNESQLRWSSLKDPETWPTNNTLEIGYKDGDQILKILSYLGNLFILKQRSAWILNGDIFDPSNPTYNLIKLITPYNFRVSTINCLTINKNGLLNIIGDNGIYEYSGGLFIVDSLINQRIPSIINNFKKVFPNFSHLKRIRHLISSGNSEIYIYPTASASATINNDLIIQLRNKSLWNMSFANQNNIIPGNSTYFGTGYVSPTIVSTNPLSAGTASANGLIDWFSSEKNHKFIAANGSTAAGSINAYWFSKEFNIGYGQFKYIVVQYKKQSGTLTIEYKIDQGTAVTTTADMNVGRGSIVRNTIPIDQMGSTIQVAFSNNNTGENFEIYGFKIPFTVIPENRLL